MSDAAVVSIENGKAVYRASGVYDCLNALLMHRLGYEGAPPPAWMQERYDAGHMHEPHIKERLLGLDYSLHADQATVEIPVGSDALIRGHIDWMNTSNRFQVSSIDGVSLPNGAGWYMTNKPDFACIVDAKALSQGSFEKWIRGSWSAMPYYLWQQAIYMYGFDTDGVVMAVLNKNTNKLITDFYTREYIENKLPLGDIIAKVLKVENLVATKGETAIFEEDCTAMYPCPFYQFGCGGGQSKLEEIEFDEEAMAKVVSQYREVQDQEKQLKKVKTELGNQIVGLMKNKEGTGRSGENVVSSYYHSSTNADWDGIGQALGVSSEDAKAKFNKPSKSNKLSARVTPPRKVS